ncbi:MAG TPA: hypothetical protein VE673_00615 [Pseudonocardiaceae bacterium]|jgi:hypothetical protein|nr:hypothetical protein [Pseudonocardiaceae bacterium]
MTFVPGSGTATRANRRAGQYAARSWWTPRWLQRQREDRELARWATELGWQWAEVADSAQLARHSVTAGRIPLTLTPQMHSVDPGPPVTLLVELLPGQVVEDYEKKAERIAAGMGVAKVHIEPYDQGWIKVVLLEEEDLPLPA